MSFAPQHISGSTTHARRGDLKNAFRYGVDFVLIEPEKPVATPLLFSRNRFNFTSVYDTDHGGPLGNGSGAHWAREVLRAKGLSDPAIRLLLLTQPRFLGYVFNPASFWLVMDPDDLVAVIVEVSTPFGDRHSYFCHLPEFAPISATSRIHAPKALHVSPFQTVAGTYEFRFDIQPTKINIRIGYRNGDQGVIATLTGRQRPMTSAGLLRASLRRPLGALRNIGLIHWQALRLKLKGAKYRRRPTPPEHEVT